MSVQIVLVRSTPENRVQVDAITIQRIGWELIGTHRGTLMAVNQA